jgi:hypothetical protein
MSRTRSTSWGSRPPASPPRIRRRPATGEGAGSLLGLRGAGGRSRASVAAELFATDVTGGTLGSFQIDRNRDTTSNPVTIDRIEHGASTTFKVSTPSPDLVGRPSEFQVENRPRG